MAKAVIETAEVSPFLGVLEAFQKERGQGDPEWLAARRRSAFEAFKANGVPTPKREAWRTTDLRPLNKLKFSLPDGPSKVAPAALDPYRLGMVDTHLAVFVDGRFAPELSRLDALPEGVEVTSLATALVERPELLEPYLASHAESSDPDDAMVALNTAFLSDGAFVRLAKGAVLDVPIHLLWLTTGRPVMVYPRTLVVADPLAEATVVESFVGRDGGYLVDAVTELVAKDDAKIDHFTIQRESPEAWHVHHVRGKAHRNARIATFSHSEGAKVARNEADIHLVEEGAECGMDGIFLGGAEQHVDNHTRIVHAAPHTDSVENYRGIMTGCAHGVFTGSVLVEKGAQKTNSDQENKNLLLSDKAHVDTTPQLEIHADDVKCAHGSTIGQLDETSLFYLRARGIPSDEARLLLTQAFAGVVLGPVRHDGLREHLEGRIAAWFETHRKEGVR
ncbi:MAG: Fe-S cluster assembly protein SufD [Euryarchaeota archaeon]|nr:Fe-S cluster assembly protein SufD [Euryarchaeota archaeon]